MYIYIYIYIYIVTLQCIYIYIYICIDIQDFGLQPDMASATPDWMEDTFAASQNLVNQAMSKIALATVAVKTRARSSKYLTEYSWNTILVHGLSICNVCLYLQIAHIYNIYIHIFLYTCSRVLVCVWIVSISIVSQVLNRLSEAMSYVLSEAMSYVDMIRVVCISLHTVQCVTCSCELTVMCAS